MYDLGHIKLKNTNILQMRSIELIISLRAWLESFRIMDSFPIVIGSAPLEHRLRVNVKRGKRETRAQCI